MSKLFNKIKELTEEIQYEVLFEPYECAWYQTEDEIHWNTDSNLEELYDGNGSTYSAELTEGVHIQDGCYFVNLDNGCGQTITNVFLGSLEVDYGDLEEMFDE
jgi:hypothetical protein